jgi:GNAT superfamily N-acetyltransferase
MGEVVKHPTALAQDITAPMPITAEHEVSRFDCGKEPLNDWIKSKAAKSEGRSSRCYVVCQGKTVIGYYCLSTGAVAHAGAPRGLRQNLPDPTPVMVIGRLAVDKEFHSRGIGTGMLKDAFSRILFASKTVGARAIIVHAIDEEAIPFYTAHDFRAFPTDSRTLWLPIATLGAAL